ncbi:MAG: hypothetical protein NWE86_01995 [Candidatus Bathyarchaeota archaeon]|nr:hypothetical protein [Candidatus Bathyarchaeota archaeon]
MRSKVVPLKEGVNLIEGNLIAIGGLTIHRKPIAFIHEIIRSKIKGLNVLTFGGGPEIDLLVAADCINRVEAAYVGFEILGFAPNFRKAVENKKIEFKECTEYSIMAGLLATTFGASFIPSKTLMGSDIKGKLGLRTIRSPFKDEELIAYPPIEPDVAIIHIQRSDMYGNAHLEGVTAIDDQLIKASKKVILTVEEIILPEKIMENPSKTRISSSLVDAVIKVPYGAHPTSCFPYYAYDLWHINEIIEYSRSGKIEEYLKKYVSSLDSFQDYLDKIGKNSLTRVKPKQ